MDLRTIYADAHERTIAMISGLPEDLLSLPVAATPAWSVRDLVGHVCGVAADLTSGNDEGAATPAWTARQVSQRRGAPLAEVVSEWRSRTPGVLEMLATPHRIDAAAFDLVTHEHDMRGALGLPGPSDLEAIELVTARLAHRIGLLVAKADLPTIRLVADGNEWTCGRGDVVVTAEASTMEWFRALMGRRSAAQVATYHWDGDPTPYFGLISLFGALPEAGVDEAGAPTP